MRHRHRSSAMARYIMLLTPDVNLAHWLSKRGFYKKYKGYHVCADPLHSNLRVIVSRNADNVKWKSPATAFCIGKQIRDGKHTISSIAINLLGHLKKLITLNGFFSSPNPHGFHGMQWSLWMHLRAKCDTAETKRCCFSPLTERPKNRWRCIQYI